MLFILYCYFSAWVYLVLFGCYQAMNKWTVLKFKERKHLEDRFSPNIW